MANGNGKWKTWVTRTAIMTVLTLVGWLVNEGYTEIGNKLDAQSTEMNARFAAQSASIATLTHKIDSLKDVQYGFNLSVELLTKDVRQLRYDLDKHREKE